MLLFLVIASLIIAILAVLFAIQNANIIIVSFLVWQFQGSLALVLLLTFALGFIAGLLIILPKLIKRSFIIPSRKKKLEESQKRLEEKDESKNVIQF
jgi:uncharacterized integral membrane protein